MRSFAEATSWTRADDGVFTGVIDEDWAQGRSAFGAILAAAGVRALAASVPAERRLRSVLVSFVGPVHPGPASAHTTALRAGGSLTQGEARIIQDGAVRCVILAAFGAARATRVPLEGPRRPAVAGPAGLTEMPYFKGVMPAFTRQFAYRWTVDTLPFSGSDTGFVQGWIRERGQAVDHAADLLALLDGWPSPVLSRATAPTPSSSVTWQVNILDELDEPVDDWWLFEAREVASWAGHGDYTAHLWRNDGRLAATSRQLIVEFSAR